MDRSVQVGIVDDIPTYRRFFDGEISARPGFGVAGAWATVDELVGEIDAGQSVDVVLMDLRLEHGVDGPAGVAFLADRGLRILVFSENRDPDVVRASFTAGAAGYVSKNEAPEEILDALALVSEGDSYVSPRFAADLLTDSRKAASAYRFSDAQREILGYVADGLTYSQIAERRFTCLKTVQNQVNAIAAHVREVNPSLAGDRNPRTFLRDVAEELGLRRTRQPQRT
ncbi:MAG: response regulator transcription factor [Acidimicrobiia bacterium]|nr:response regulator transcription factor [Acidimicrobiia bacterium]